MPKQCSQWVSKTSTTTWFCELIGFLFFATSLTAQTWQFPCWDCRHCIPWIESCDQSSCNIDKNYTLRSLLETDSPIHEVKLFESNPFGELILVWLWLSTCAKGFHSFAPITHSHWLSVVKSNIELVGTWHTTNTTSKKLNKQYFS